MSWLLDTHVLLWVLEDSPRLGPRAREVLQAEGRVHVSSASLWEIAIKRGLGKIEAPDDLPVLVERSGLDWLAVEPSDAWGIEEVTGLPHRDPFDRLLLSQAHRAGLALLTADRVLLESRLDPAVRRLDARE